METIHLKEYETESVELCDQDIAFISRELIGKIAISRELEGRKYKLNPSQYVGLISLPSGRTIEIRPKIPISSLFYLVAIAFELPSPFRQELAKLERLDQIFEFIASFFADLVEERIANGMYRWYVEREENVPAIRGRINFSEDARRNFISRQRTHCRFDEFTWDIPENQVIRQVVHSLSGWRFRHELRLRLARIDAELGEVARTTLSSEDVKRFQYHRMNENYRQVHQLCNLFLQNASLAEAIGTFSYRAFLLDMNKLFEEFVCQLLRNRAPRRVGIQSQECTFLDRDNKIRMKPDILIRHKGTVVLAADCKYKRLESDEYKNHDVYQILAYCIATNTPQGLLVYPKYLEDIPGDVWITRAGVHIRQVSIELDKESRELARSCDSFADELLESLLIRRAA